MKNNKNKYLKYKNKYLNLKNQLAGMRLFDPSPENSPDKRYNSPKKIELNYDSSNKINPVILIDQRNFNNLDVLSTTDKEIISLLNLQYPNNWILTGSVAVKLYLVYLNLQNLITFVTSDIDALIIKNSKLCNVDERIIGDYIRKQETPQRSVTFLNNINNSSFDISCIKSMSTINTIFGINIISPKILLRYYLDDFRDKDEEKINALKQIIDKINNNNYNLHV